MTIGDKLVIGEDVIIIVSFKNLGKYTIINYVIADSDITGRFICPTVYDFISDNFKSRIKSYKENGFVSLKKYTNTVPYIVYETDTEYIGLENLGLIIIILGYTVPVLYFTDLPYNY